MFVQGPFCCPATFLCSAPDEGAACSMPRPYDGDCRADRVTEQSDTFHLPGIPPANARTAGPLCRLAVQFASSIHHCQPHADVKVQTPNMGVSPAAQNRDELRPDSIAGAAWPFLTLLINPFIRGLKTNVLSAVAAFLHILYRMHRIPLELSDSFASVVEKHRQAKGLSRSALASEAGLHQTYIGLLERGQRSPNLDTAQAIARSLGCSLSQLIIEAEKLQQKKARKR